MWDKSAFIPLYKRRHDSNPSGNSLLGTCSYLGVSGTRQSPGLSGIWRNPGGVGLIVGNYGNDCAMKPRWPGPEPGPRPQPPHPCILYVTQHFRPKYSQGATEDGSEEIVQGERMLLPPAPVQLCSGVRC